MTAKNRKERYSLRKLKGGVGSVLVGTLLLTGTSVVMAEELSGSEGQMDTGGNTLISGSDFSWNGDSFSFEGDSFILDGEKEDIVKGKEAYPMAQVASKALEGEPRNPETTSPAPPTLKLENDSVIVTPPEDEDVAAVELDGTFIFDEESQGDLFPKATKSSDEWKLSDMGWFNGIKLDPKTGQWTIPLESLVKETDLSATAVYNDGKQSEKVSIGIPSATPAPESTPSPTESPAEKTPSSPTEAPAEKAPTSPTESPAAKAPTSPTESPAAKAPTSPTESPAEKTPTSPTESPAAKAPTSPTEAPADKAPTSPTEAPADKVPSAPAESPAAKAPTSPTEAPADKSPEAPAPLTRKPGGLGLGSSKQGLSEQEKQVMRLLEGAYTIFLYTDKERIEYPFHGTPEELEKKIKETITAYKSGHYPYVERFQNDKRVLLQFYKEKYLLRVISGDEGSRQHVETPFYDKEKLEDRIQELQNGADGYDVLKQEDEDKDKKSYNKRVTLTFTRKVEKKIEPELHEEKPFFPETEVPMKPEVPKQPEVPMKPEAPKQAEVPMKPEAPKQAEVPMKPEAPKQAEVPMKPESPKQAEVPMKPEAPKQAEVPMKPESPKQAEAPMKPEAPKQAEVPIKPESPKQPEVPMKPESPKQAEAPMKPEAPKQSEAPMKPEAPKQSEAPMKPEAPKQVEVPMKPEAPKQPEAPMKSAVTQATRMAQPQKAEQLPVTGDLPSALTWLGGSLFGLLGLVHKKRKN
ncbi:YSIRK-type signal peptide-containing protein [Streptococcus ovuberis]